MTDLNQALLTMIPASLEISSRIQSAITGSGSDGASCNTFTVDDSVDGPNGIAASLSWAMRIHKLEGAPTINLSNLRANGSKAGDHGTASGPCSFARVYDQIALTMLRPTKKNGVCVLFLRADHPDIGEWLTLAEYMQRCYTGVLLTPGVKYSDELLARIATAYDRRSVTFICKATLDDDGTLLLPNVCTEIRQSHKGFCTLSAIKVYQLANKPISQWVTAGKQIGSWMNNLLYLKMRPTAEQNPDLYRFDDQVGIGLVGFANLLGSTGVTYQEMIDAYPTVQLPVDDRDPIDFVEQAIALACELREDKAIQVWCRLIAMYAAIQQQMPTVKRIFTQQPTAHTALRLSHKIDGKHYSVAPEIAAPFAVRGSDGLSRATNQSELRGDTALTYHPSVQVRDEVTASQYRAICECFQDIWDTLEAAHTISYSPYDELIDLPYLKRFISSNLGSLYYRMDPTPANTYNKSETWDDEGDLGDLIDDTDEQPTTCSVASKGTCEACSM